MGRDAVIAAASEDFARVFGTAPAHIAYAPGRVNLLGEHTDYNGGLVLPMPLALGTAVVVGLGGPKDVVQVSSAGFDTVETRQLSDAAQDHWTDYIVGSLIHILNGHDLSQGLQIAVATDLPIGSGLSSSAAIEVATMRATAALIGREMTNVALAQLARQAENTYVGMPCGIMDQYSVAVGSPGTAVFLDTRALVSEVAPLPTDHRFVVVHSGVSHQLVDGGYEKRVQQCQAACRALNVEMLSDLGLDDLPKIETIEDVLAARARHIVTENDRVRRAVAALKADDLTLFAQLMVESHISQRDDYAVSVPAVDALVDGALAAGAMGARLTGGGFGGSIVAFMPSPHVPAWCNAIEAQFSDAQILAVT